MGCLLGQKRVAEDIESQERALDEAMAEAMKLRKRAVASGSAQDMDVFTACLLQVFREHREALERRGADVDASIRELEEEREEFLKSNAKRGALAEKLREYQVGPHSGVPYIR
jgi:hypothetical protein